MEDKELLELAAKGAGYSVRYVSDGKGGGCFYMEPSQLLWNPLIDDGDALRALAVMPSLWSLKLMFGTPSIVMDVAWGTGKGIVVSQRSSQYEDRATAIRRAIVMALAEIAQARASNDEAKGRAACGTSSD